jgi:hypothetical protein
MAISHPSAPLTFTVVQGWFLKAFSATHLASGSKKSFPNQMVLPLKTVSPISQPVPNSIAHSGKSMQSHFYIVAKI